MTNNLKKIFFGGLVLGLILGFLLNNIFSNNTIFIHRNLNAYELVGIEVPSLGYEWLENVDVIDFGGFRIYVNADNNETNLIAFHPVSSPNFPAFAMGIDESNDMLTSMFSDPSGRALSVGFNSQSSEFTEYDFSFIRDGKRLSFMDSNLDGFADMKLVWGDSPALYQRVKPEWIRIK